MITFLDENDVEYGALATIKATNAVNGERSLTGTIVSGDYVLSNIERGWRLRFDDEYYVVTYAKPIDKGRDVQVEFDAVHQFFWDFDKSSVYDQLSDGSHTFVAYLDFIFKNSGYSYTIDSALNVHAFEKQSFGFKKRLTLFNDIITSTGVEFQVNGKVVRILEKVGTDLSTVVRKNFNMNELTIEKNIGDFVTYQKGFGAYFDEEDHSKGRLEVEYTSPLASVYGKLEAEPFVDERYSQSSSLLAALKENVDNSYTISVSLDMEDLTRAGYKYKQPVAGDYIMAINETLDFQEKIRIVSFTSEYDVQGVLVKHGVTCNDIGSVKKLSASYTHTQHQAANAEANANTAYEFANKALISADGKNTNYYGDTFPVDNPKGTLKKGDLLFLTVGDTVKQYYWNGADWIINPVLDDVEAFKEQIAEELKDVPNREEFENKISEELATSKAEIATQIETAKTQAESNAKEYADTINQETAKVAELANAAADEIKADLVNVKNNLASTSLVANNAQAAVDAAKQDLANVNTKVDNAKEEIDKAKQDLTNVASELTTAKQDLTSHAQQLQTQADAQTELSKRVTSVETTANGTKTTVNELTKTVAQNGKDITSVTNRTKTVEDDLANTKTTLTQVQTTANSASQKTATLETGLNGLTAKFSNLKIGSRNYFKDSKSRKYYINDAGIQDVRTYIDDEFWQNDTRFTKDYVRMSFDIAFNPALPADFATNVHFNVSPWYNCGGITFKGGTTALQHFDLKFDLSSAARDYQADNIFIRLHNTLPLNTAVSLENFNLYLSAVVEDYSQNDADIEQKVAEYKQNADQNYASLQTTVQNLDGTVKQNKSEFDQTASQLKTSISAVEGKIPTSVGARNYIRNYGLTATGWGINKAGWKFEIVSDSTAKSGQYLKATCTTASTSGGGFYKNLFDFSDGRFFGKQMTWSMDIKLSKNKPVKIGPEWGYAYLDTNATTEWKRYSKTFTVATTTEYNNWIFYTNDKNWNVGDVVYIRDVQLEDGSIATSPVPAIEDTESDITKLSSELTQTKDGITLLATKTELNTAKNELQSGINTATNKANAAQNAANNNAQTISTHTTQISALNTGLQAKVSQTDFNTLSGRVTSAENNITAKANELSSKITSVEGKIPTSSGGRNLAQGTSKDWSKPFTKFKGIENTTIGLYRVLTDGLSVGDKLKTRIVLKYTDIVPTSGQTAIIRLQGSGDVTGWKTGCYNFGAWKTISGSGEMVFEHEFKITADHLKNSYWSLVFRTDWIASGSLQWRLAKVERGMFFTDWSPAPEDTIEQINAVSSELKQTADGMTLLATKTELNNAKNELQSGIATATSKADNAQVTANSNAQTISTHTTQISALNTGLSAKVSQSDFNTLSGRVTTAENNITAKANELSSKITSVEGKIPTEIGAVNLFKGSRDFSGTDWIGGAGVYVEDYKGVKIFKKQDVWGGRSQYFEAKAGEEYVFSAYVKSSAKTDAVNFYLPHDSKQPKASGLVSFGSDNGQNVVNIGLTDKYKRIAVKIKITQDGWVAPRIERYDSNNYLFFGGYKLERGNIATDWSPAPEDTVVGGRNYALKTGDSKSSTADGKLYDLSSAFDNIADDATLIIEFDWSVTAPTSTSKFRINRVITYSDGTAEQWNDTIVTDGVYTDVSSSGGSGHYSGTFTKVPYDGKAVSSRYLYLNQSTASGTVTISNLSVRVGSLKSDWQPAPEDYDSKLATAQSEFKQTTDAIKASVSSLDSSTVKSSSLTINADGIVMKAGKSTTDVANAIGSYFAVNQNAINLFSDKINVKGNMIVSGAITSDKIASKSINTAHLNGKIITADVIATNAITANAIKAGAVTTDKMSANSINGDRIAAGTLDAAKIKAGSITASQIASGTITSNQIKAGGISSANIAAGAITTDKIAAGAIDANKIAANAITANMIRGGQLKSTNGATSFDLNAGTLTFNNDYGYIQRVSSDKVFEITTYLGKDAGSRDYLTSDFTIRKSDNSRQAGAKFTLYNPAADKPTAQANINIDSLIISDSKNIPFFAMYTKGAFGNGDFHGWGDIPLADFFGSGLLAGDIVVGGHRKSLKKIVEELCDKAGIWWL